MFFVSGRIVLSRSVYLCNLDVAVELQFLYQFSRHYLSVALVSLFPFQLPMLGDIVGLLCLHLISSSINSFT